MRGHFLMNKYWFSLKSCSFLILDKSTALDEHTNTMSIVLGVVLTVAVLGIILMAGMMFYSYRKGLLRHVPLSYSTFKNSDNDQRASFDSRQQSVHI